MYGKNLVICDCEEQYAKNLLQVLSHVHQTETSLYLFYTIQELKKFSEQKRIDCLLISSDYITATGTVYHKDYHCSYLQPSIQYVPQAQVDHLRNKDGGKYHACARCMRGTSMGGVYITDYGRNYHSSVQCSGLKRTIRAVKKSQCGGRPACSKCGSGN